MKTLFTSIFIVSFLGLFAQNELPKISILPEGRLFKPLIFDPNESQAFGSVVAYWEQGVFTERVFLPFGLGFYKGFLRNNSKHPWEIGFDFAANSQFLWTFDEGRSERNFHNIDFKVSVMLNKQVNANNSFRLRFYHVSSHLGDDYILRNGIHSYFPNPNNYEQLDFTWAICKKETRYYGGTGAVVRPETIRKRLSFQGGFEYDPKMKDGKLTAFFMGMHIRSLAQNNFDPDVKAGLGLKIGNVEKPLRLMAEFYKGNMPYGPYEFVKIQWLGAGLYFMP